MMKFLHLILLLVGTVESKLDGSEIKRIDVSSLKQMRRMQQTSSTCLEDTEYIEEHANLSDNFQLALASFTEAFSLSPQSYCTTIAEGTIKSSICAADYSLFNATETYSSICEDEIGATSYPVSILMRCSKESSNLEMELMNIPSCIGKSCDTQHLYLSLLNVLAGIEVSMGNGASSDWDWTCAFYHDFESLRVAPHNVIEIGKDDGLTNTSEGYEKHYGSAVIIALAVTILTLLS